VSPRTRHPATWSSGSGRFLLGKNRMFESCCGYQRTALTSECVVQRGMTWMLIASSSRPRRLAGERGYACGYGQESRPRLGTVRHDV
jgi:hypothetical protein